MDTREPVVFQTGFELVGLPRRSGLCEAKLDPLNGDLLSITLMESDPLTESERAQVLDNISALLEEVGADLVRQFHATKPADTVDAEIVSEVSH